MLPAATTSNMPTTSAAPAEPKPPRLLDQVRDKLRKLHYSPRTEEAYVGWIKRFIWFHGKRHPKDMAEPEVEAFLSNLATQRGVSASTQNQALCSLLFLYKRVLGVELGWVDGVTRAKRPERVPVVLTREEVALVLQQMQGREWLMASLMYGSDQAASWLMASLMYGSDQAASYRPHGAPEGDADGGAAGGVIEAGDASHLTSLFRHSLA